MAFVLNRLTLEAMDQAALVHRHAFNERLPWLAGLHTPAEDRAYFRDKVFADCQVWGALNEDLIGFIAFRTGWVDQLYILPGHQGHGVGTALLGVAKAANASLLLRTFQKNTAARRFYESHGFVAVEETDGSANEEREPDVLYRWEGRG